MAEATPVELKRTKGSWALLRGGEPYFIRGAGGNHSLELLAAAGANSVRTWDAEDLEPLLDEAHALGLTVTVGIWLGHQRHGFDYDDPEQVAEQRQRVRRAVLRYKDHPAVLFRPDMPAIEGAIEAGDIDGARVRMPAQPGPYRLFLYAYDEAGHGATANVPLLVAGEERRPLPFPVYEDGFRSMPWIPSGWMGDIDHLALDGEYPDEVREGAHSIRLSFEKPVGWVGVAWQDPPNNWGDQEGGYDLRGAGELELWARGEYGGERVSFGVGLLEEDKAQSDSAIRKVDGIVLTREWRRYTVPLTGADLSSVKTGFVVTLTGRATPVTVYLDDIRYLR